MNSCELINSKKVICDEIFYLEHEENDVSIEYFEDIPDGSTISGTVEVTLTDCNVFVVNDLFLVNFIFVVQKELEITTPEPDSEIIPLEYLERLQFEDIEFRKCSPAIIEEQGINLNDLKCEVIRTNARDTIELDTDNDSFDEDLNIEIKIKIIADVQEFIQGKDKELETVINVEDVG